MKYSESIEKLEKYFDRLHKGKAEKIKPGHVKKVIKKLKLKRELLIEEQAETKKETTKERLGLKLLTVAEQIKRAEWLLGEIGAVTPDED